MRENPLRTQKEWKKVEIWRKHLQDCSFIFWCIYSEWESHLRCRPCRIWWHNLPLPYVSHPFGSCSDALKKDSAVEIRLRSILLAKRWFWQWCIYCSSCTFIAADQCQEFIYSFSKAQTTGLRCPYIFSLHQPLWATGWWERKEACPTSHLCIRSPPSSSSVTARWHSWWAYSTTTSLQWEMDLSQRLQTHCWIPPRPYSTLIQGLSPTATARLKVPYCRLKPQRLARPIVILKLASFSSLTVEMKATMQFWEREGERTPVTQQQS